MNLSSFLASNAKRVERVKYCPSDRFSEDGKLIEWEIGCITAKENNEIRAKCIVESKNPKRGQTFLDTGLYQAMIVSSSVIYPDLNSSVLQDSYGVKSKEELIATMLTPGEFENLSEKVLEVNGFKTDEEITIEAKN